MIHVGVCFYNYILNMCGSVGALAGNIGGYQYYAMRHGCTMVAEVRCARTSRPGNDLSPNK
jgi:hypothetical protein